MTANQEKSVKQKPKAWPNENASPVPSYLGIVISNGHVDVSDYSHSPDADALVILLGALGVQPDSVRISQCG